MIMAVFCVKRKVNDGSGEVIVWRQRWCCGGGGGQEGTGP